MRSNPASGSDDTQIFIGDTMGELLLFYACADVAFVGGSLVEKGGQNPLEPAAVGVPIIMGPHVFNFASIHQKLQEAGALLTIHDAQALATQVFNLLQNPNQRKQMLDNGRHVLAQNKGALIKQVALIEELLSKEDSKILS